MSQRFSNRYAEVVIEQYPDVKGFSRKQWNPAAKATLQFLANMVVSEVEQGLPGGGRSSFPGWKSRGVMRRMLGATKPVKKTGYFQIYAGFVKRNRYRNKALLAHEYGVTIYPKRFPYLRFKNRQGQWVSARKVTIRRKSFFTLGWMRATTKMPSVIGPYFKKALGPV